MGVKVIDRRVLTTADPAAVYRVLRDGPSWPQWSPLDSFEFVAPGDDGDPDGVGAVRIFRTGRTTSRERIVELVPQRRLSYVLEEGMPLRDYRADVDLTPAAGGGTEIRWRSTFQPKIAGTGWFYRSVLDKFIARMAGGLAERAVREAGARATAAS